MRRGTSGPPPHDRPLFQPAMSQLHGGSTAAATGCCAVCGATVKLVASTGAIHRHGHGHGRPACAGSGRLPQAPPPPALDASADLFDDSPVPPTQGGASTLGFVIDAPSRATLRRIPQGARQRASQAFATRLRALLSSPDDLGRWRDALQFGECLSQPARGGKRYNLTTQIVNQIDRAVKGQGSAPMEPAAAPTHRPGGTRKIADEEDKVVSRASAKLQEGDIRGAVRCLCSDETLAPSTSATHQALLAKHPSRPADRRAPPSATATPPMTVSASDVKVAIRSFTPGSAGGRDGLTLQRT